MAILRWSQEHQIEWHYIAPGKPQQNAFIESFNARLRDELLNETVFSSLNEARICSNSGGATTTPTTSLKARLADAIRVRRAQPP